MIKACSTMGNSLRFGDDAVRPDVEAVARPPVFQVQSLVAGKDNAQVEALVGAEADADRRGVRMRVVTKKGAGMGLAEHAGPIDLDAGAHGERVGGRQPRVELAHTPRLRCGVD